jgi:hypothetical protein
MEFVAFSTVSAEAVGAKHFPNPYHICYFGSLELTRTAEGNV